MLHYANVTDMVLGREPEGGMVLQQPKVIRVSGVPYDTNTRCPIFQAGFVVALP